MKDQYQHYLTTEEVSQVLGVSIRTLARYSRSKKLVPVRVGNKNLYDPEIVAHFSADAESVFSKLDKQTSYNSYRISQLELRIAALESLLEINGMGYISESDVEPEQVKKAFQEQLNIKKWNIETIETVLSDVSKLSDSLIKKVGYKLVLDMLTACQIYARMLKHNRKKLVLAQASYIKKRITALS